MAGYTYDRIEQLERELMLSPAEVRLRHADRLEELLLSLDAEAQYPYEFVYFRVTGFHARRPVLEACEGRRLLSDLALLLDRLSERAPAPVSQVSERVFTVQELAALHDVTVRTIYRWRRRGLASRRYLYPDGRRRRGVRETALERFVEANREFVERSSRFSRLSPGERAEILDQARELARRSGLSLTAAAECIAHRTGRAKTTVRAALKAGSGEDEGEPAFRGGPGRLRPDQRRLLYQAYRAGQAVGHLAHRFGRSRASIHRIINEMRARRLLEPSPSDTYILDEQFLKDDAEECILGDGVDVPADPLGQTAAESAGPLLSEKQQESLLRKYNYLKHRAAELKKGLNPARYVPSGVLDEIEDLLGRAAAVKKRLLGANLDLVAGVARQHAGSMVGLDELVSEAVLCLVRAIESFDYRRGGRFRAYAAWSLMRSFARTVPEEHYRRRGEPATGEGAPPAELWDRLEAELGALTERERQAIILRLSRDGGRRTHP